MLVARKRFEVFERWVRELMIAQMWARSEGVGFTTFDFPCEEEEGLFHHHSHRENGSHYHKRNQ
ncbi:hypothetical protein Csa_015013 [Cucumis sativus]|uniref:Uncharacterized protein n=1 Tax=Cucumis sativus TaxID=3659 RepID=A0A0A0KVJ8_CUCSA|nr:hypothetical protein Csa_015013 [Cucumis sativus]